MRTRLLLSVLLLVVLALSAAYLAGCAKPPAEPTPPPAPPPPAAEAPPAAAPGEFAWTEDPALDQIPEGTIKGMINGKPFEAKTVRVEQDEKGKSTLVISDKAVDKPTDMLMEDTGVDLDFTLGEKPGEFVVGQKADKDFDKEHAYYHYPQGGDKGPMSVNPEWACALQIDEWKLEPDPSNEEVLGKVKGKVAVTFGDEDKKSWVAGTFECVYMK